LTLHDALTDTTPFMVLGPPPACKPQGFACACGATRPSVLSWDQHAQWSKDHNEHMQDYWAGGSLAAMVLLRDIRIGRYNPWLGDYSI
jgi:hypothetical protein